MRGLKFIRASYSVSCSILAVPCKNCQLTGGSYAATLTHRLTLASTILNRETGCGHSETFWAVVGQENGNVDRLVKISFRLGDPVSMDADLLAIHADIEVRQPRVQ